MTSLAFQYDDGGRAAAGFKGRAGDCVCRAICIAGGLDYAPTYKVLADGNASQRITKLSAKRRSAGIRTAAMGIHVQRKWFKDFMITQGFVWVPTMQIGSGCKAHLRPGELPMGRLVVQVSRHFTTVIDGVIHDTFDPSAGGDRCVYGYWKLMR